MRYPSIEPYEHGMLDVGDGNRLYWETCGDPDGKPALVVHGGPGSGCTAGMRRSFDPDRYRIVLFDQRGCGRSTPNASDPATDMSVNTTEHLLADMERPREHLGIGRFIPAEWNRFAWPDAQLVVVDDSGHTGSESMQAQVRGALDRFAVR